MIRILIVEDSDVTAMLLSAIFDNEQDMSVIGRARTGLEAIEMASRLNPDLLTMDIRMPVMDGISTIKEIMSTRPKPIVVISSNVEDELQISFRAIDEGALAVLEKPSAINAPDFSSIQKEIVDTVRVMSEIKLVKRRPQMAQKQAFYVRRESNGCRYKVLAIGSSTGGPQALKQILSSLPTDFAMPIVIAQHISPGFLEGLVSWLNDHSPLHIKIAEHGEKLLPRTVYFAPDFHHCQVNKDGHLLLIELNTEDAINGFRPSATPLMESVADKCDGNAIGIILSGMGRDGAQGLLSMYRKNCTTIAQDEASSIVFGMPAAAIDLGAVNQVLPVKDIAAEVLRLMENS